VKAVTVFASLGLRQPPAAVRDHEQREQVRSNMNPDDLVEIR
jgi:hypothetical protein